MTQTITNDAKVKALKAVAFTVAGQILHLDELLSFEPEKKRGRYESSGGDPLPESLAERFREQLADLKLGFDLVTAAVEKMEKQS